MNANNISDGSILTRNDNGIGIIEFAHPKGNSLPGKLLDKLAVQIQLFGENPDCKALLIRSQGNGPFCAGASFDELLNLKSQEQSEVFFSGFAKVMSAMISCPKFIVCRVQGKAIGGGVGLIAASDYVLAHKDSSIKLSELSIGFGPFIIGPIVERKLGRANFQNLTIDSEWRDSSWCCERGLFSTLHESIEELDRATSAILKELSERNIEAMRSLKKIFWEDSSTLSNLIFTRVKETAKLALSPFVREKVQALVKK